MNGFLLVFGRPGDERLSRRIALIRRRLPASWRPVVEDPDLCVWIEGALDCGRPSLDAPIVTIGRVFARDATDGALPSVSSPPLLAHDHEIALGKRMLKRSWGAYVALIRDPSRPGRLSVLRDPLGALDCLAWQSEGITFVASDLSPAIRVATDPPLALDWDRIAALLAHPVDAGEALGFRDIKAVEPGVLTSFEGNRREETILWSPADHCAGRVRPEPADPHRLERLIDDCTASWRGCYQTVLAEISGGLDSAIIVASVHKVAPSRSTLGVHFFASQPEGDERAFARSAAEALDVPLTVLSRETRAISAAEIDAAAVWARPAINAMDIHYDGALADQARLQGADAIFTGQGGDAVFFQMADAAVASDLAFERGRTREWLGVASRVAVWTQRSIWTVLGQLMWPRQSVIPPPRPVPFLRSTSSRWSPHRWLAGTDDLTPAKRLQLWGLVNSRVYFGASLRTLAAEVVHPLMSQPVVEHLLAIPVIELTVGSRDRWLARQAFASRLPDKVVWRRGKGDLTAYYGRLVARSAPMLRTYLCDGLLASRGLIDTTALSQMLEPDQLARQDYYSEILTAALIEGWTRYWQAQATAVSDPAR